MILILIAAAVFLAVYLFPRHFGFSQNNSDGESHVVGSRSGGFLIATIAVLSLIFILPRLGISLVGLLQKALAFSPNIRAPFTVLGLAHP